jgi:hypothetical protein
MKLFLIEADVGGWDTAQGFVIAAETEEEARAIANDNGGDECGHYGRRTPFWSSNGRCEVLAAQVDGPARLILRDFASG